MVYHVVFPLDGVDHSFYYSFARNVLVGPAVSLVVGYLIYRGLARKPFFFSIRKKIVLLALGVLTVGVVALSAGYVQHRFGAVAFCQKMIGILDQEESAYFSENYAPVREDEVAFPNGKNNLLLIVLESAEANLADETVFGGNLIPKLEKVAKDNISFSRHVQTFGTGWSIAGMCSYLVGVPLIVPGMKETSVIYNSQQFLPGATSLLRILDSAGYDITLLLGANVKFAGFDLLFSSHCRTPKLEDPVILYERYPSLSPASGRWGLPDQVIYEEMKKKVTAWNDDETPRALVVATVNTHHPGYKEESSRSVYYDARDTFIEMDDITADFLTWFRDQPVAQNTTVILVGDHLYMNDELGAAKLPPKSERQIYNAILNSRVRPELPADSRRFASYDFAPTILESLGGVLPGRRLGLGTSLFSSEPTLLERDGLARYEQEIAKYSPLYNSFFQADKATAAR